MGTTVYVRDFRGNLLQRGATEMGGLLAAARQACLPLLGSVDEYDDTVFNRSQVALVLEELDRLELSADLEHARSELILMAGGVQQRPHRYLVFNGD